MCGVCKEIAVIVLSPECGILQRNIRYYLSPECVVFYKDIVVIALSIKCVLLYILNVWYFTKK
jgi:hypothetical protein